MRISLRTPAPAQQRAFLQAVQRSRRAHAPWVQPPSTPQAYRVYVESLAGDARKGFLVCVTGHEYALAGVVNLNEIVRGSFKSAYLGYYGFDPHIGTGVMSAGMRLVLDRAFGPLRLHRVEANIQPGNDRSRALVERLGFRCEGFSPRYLKVGGRWRDHERWALLAEEWRGETLDTLEG